MCGKKECKIEQKDRRAFLYNYYADCKTIAFKKSNSF